MFSAKADQARQTEPTWMGGQPDYFRERDMKYGTIELQVLAVVKPQTDMTATTPSPTTFRELRQTLDSVPRQSQMLQVTSRPQSSQKRLRSEKPQTDKHIASIMPDAVPGSSLMEIGTADKPVSFYPCISHA